MTRVSLLLLLLLPAAGFPAELELTAGSGQIANTAVASDPVFAGVAVSGGENAGVRYGASLSGATYGASDYNEQRIGAGLSYRFPISRGFFWEPRVEVAYIEYRSARPATSPQWRDGNASAIAPGVKVGYRAGHLTLGLAARQQFADASIDMNIAANANCTTNCTGIDNIIYNPYAGLDVTAPDTATEASLKSSTWLEASVGVAF